MIVLFVVSTIIAAWVVYFGGADWLEGTLASAFVIDPAAPLWSAAGIKLFTMVAWIASFLGWLFV